MRILRIKIGSQTEADFLDVLKNHGVHMECLLHRIVNQRREYLLSDGLFRIIHTELEGIGGLYI